MMSESGEWREPDRALFKALAMRALLREFLRRDMVMLPGGWQGEVLECGDGSATEPMRKSETDKESV